jgi:GT2 family glycosyltransferase
MKVQCNKCKIVLPLVEGGRTNIECAVCGGVEFKSISDKEGTLHCGGCGLTIKLFPHVIFKSRHICENQLEKCVYLFKEFIPAMEGRLLFNERVDEPKSNRFIDISVVIVTRNNIETTHRCLKHITSSELTPREIILVDNASTDNTVEWAEKEGYFVIKNLSNLGCGIARNQGAKVAKSDYILFLDNDQFISPDTISKLFEKIKKFDAVGVEHWRVLHTGETVPLKIENLITDSYIGAGGMLVRREVFLSVGGFDERYAPLWYEDVDFSFRMRKNGKTMGVLQEAGIRHLGGTTSTQEKVAKEPRRDLFLQLWKDYLPGGVHVGKRKPIIMLLVDVHGWAWDVKAQQIKKYLSDDFEFSIIYCQDGGTGFKEAMDLRPEIIFTFECNFATKFPEKVYSMTKFLTGVTSHTYTNHLTFDVPLKRAFAIHANSRLLLKEIKKYNRNCFYVPNGVDIDAFEFQPYPENKTFTVGYAGKGKKRKGVEDYIIPACKMAGVTFVGAVAKYDDPGRVEFKNMPAFYGQVDCIAVASDMDGTPNQLLEAAACGRTFVGNAIGNIPEFHTRKNGILVERKIEKYAEAFKRLKNDRLLCKDMGEEARVTVLKDWTWKKQAENYRTMFFEVLESK